MKRLTMRDLAATACIAGATVIYWLHAVADTGGGLTGSRIGGVVIFMLGLMACSANGQQVTEGGYARLMSIAGGVALAIGVVVLITGSGAWLTAMFVLIVAMWVVTTVRHAMGMHLAEQPIYATQRSAWR
jgi:hypothetical protein